MGFRHLHSFNLAMLGKQGWKISQDPNALISKLLKAKYFPKGDFAITQVGNHLSFTWRSILRSRAVLERGCRWRVGDGRRINVWRDAWLVDNENFKVETHVIEELENLCVADLMIPG